MPSFDMSSMPESMRSKISAKDRLPFGKVGMTCEDASCKFERTAERKLHEQIMGFLKIRGVRFIVRSRMDRRPTNGSGVPDLIFPFCGRFIALEVKIGSNKTTPEQAQAIEDIIKDGGIALVVRSLEAVKTLLDGLKGNQ